MEKLLTLNLVYPQKIPDILDVPNFAEIPAARTQYILPTLANAFGCSVVIIQTPLQIKGESKTLYVWPTERFGVANKFPCVRCRQE